MYLPVRVGKLPKDLVLIQMMVDGNLLNIRINEKEAVDLLVGLSAIPEVLNEAIKRKANGCDPETIE